MVSYTARVMDESGLPGRIYDGSKHFQFTLGEGEVRILRMLLGKAHPTLVSCCTRVCTDAVESAPIA
jgi:hypothetical protein